MQTKYSAHSIQSFSNNIFLKYHLLVLAEIQPTLPYPLTRNLPAAHGPGACYLRRNQQVIERWELLLFLRCRSFFVSSFFLSISCRRGSFNNVCSCFFRMGRVWELLLLLGGLLWGHDLEGSLKPKIKVNSTLVVCFLPIISHPKKFGVGFLFGVGSVDQRSDFSSGWDLFLHDQISLWGGITHGRAPTP